MGAEGRKTAATWALLGFIAGYVLALVQRPPQRFPAPLSARVADTIDLMERTRGKRNASS